MGNVSPLCFTKGIMPILIERGANLSEIYVGCTKRASGQIKGKGRNC